MLPMAASTEELIELAKSKDLYKALLRQLTKDFSLANIELDLDLTTEPRELKRILLNEVQRLIEEEKEQFVNLLYIVDLPENYFINNANKNVLTTSEELTFLILKRIWQKVWYKNFYT
ncbi:hypothetical protein [Eudoraea chungangensis]|uniref:hypothetical protein n=1 Tax=Eudoraea chungangensis TaxID=1481905 RepID=UPI0023EBE08E|nr:hypothetical protein [Eudoraea chungangensis]